MWKQSPAKISEAMMIIICFSFALCSTQKRMMMMKQREQKVYDPVIDIDDECFAFVVP